MLVASALNGLLSVLTGSEDSGVNALKQHRQYKYQRLPDIISSFRGNFSSDLTSILCCVNFMRCPRGMRLKDARIKISPTVFSMDDHGYYKEIPRKVLALGVNS